MVCKKEFDNKHTIILKFFNHSKCVSWTIFEIVDDEYIFNKNVRNCFFADCLITLSGFKKNIIKKL